MYDPTRLELIRGKEDDRRRALAHATHRREVKENRRAREARGPSITVAGFLRRTADRLDKPCDEDRPLDTLVRTGIE